MTTKTRLSILGLALLAGLLVLAGLGLWTLETVRVNGPVYARIIQGKDLVADILPPPEYALEAHDVGLQLAREPDARRRAELAERLRALGKEFGERHEFWSKELEPGALRDQLDVNYRAGQAFFGVLLGEVVPARLRGEDASEAQARAAKLFDAHRSEVLKLVKLGDDRSKADEEGAREIVRRRLMLLLVVTLLVAAVEIVMAVLTFRQVGHGIGSLLREADGLGVAVARGELGHRAAAEALPAEFAPVARAMNSTMDAFAKPFRMASENMDRISKGDIPEEIRETYQGDFDDIKQSLNRCISAVAAVVADGNALATAALEGKLAVRADATRHQGDFRAIVQGFNATLDAVLTPVNEATRALERLAQRDLRARVTASYQGDHARIVDALNATGGALQEAMSQVAQAVEQVSSSSSQIASSSQSVANGASEQASALEETGSSLESLAGMTKTAADNAQQASALATTAKGAAAEGSAAMEQMTGAMGRIKASAEGTSQIIKDINEIAFQTNLLALNAAVEAARAGEAGRGFAVVAEEVRSLALRSKEAASKTEELIRLSVKEAGEGEVTAQHVNEKLSEIVTSVSKVTDIVAEIAAAAKEQAAGIDQVSKATGQMNAVTQQNAASSEESSSAAAELSSQAEKLSALVVTFQLERALTARRPAAQAKPRLAPTKADHAPRKGGGIALRPEEVLPLDGDAAFDEF